MMFRPVDRGGDKGMKFFGGAKREASSGGLKPIRQPSMNPMECKLDVERALALWRKGIVEAHHSILSITLVVGAGDEYQPLSSSADPILHQIRKLLSEHGPSVEALKAIQNLYPRMVHSG
jgi:hypothetical protein